jgi:type IV secretory pathway VirB2 component (pilin)
MSKFLRSHIAKSLYVAQVAAATILCAVYSGPASAAALGGLTVAKTTADDVKTGVFALVGVLALIYMLYLGVMAFTEKKSWADFGWGAVHVSLVGAAVTLGGWAWTLLA